MSSQRYTSRFLQFRARLRDRLAAAAWPPVPELEGWTPHIGWSGDAVEFVMIDRVASNLLVEALGPTMRGETITATVVIYTGLIGYSEEQCMERLGLLADVVQRLFFDDDGPFPEPVSFGIDGEYSSAAIERVELMPGRTPEGFEARCEIDVSVSADV